MFSILPFHTLSNRQLLKFKKSIESELYVVESKITKNQTIARTSKDRN